jgi:hypothetical protein
MINTKSKLALFWRFSITTVFVFSISLTTVLVPLATPFGFTDY